MQPDIGPNKLTVDRCKLTLDGCRVTLGRCKPTSSRCRLTADRCRPPSTVAGRRKSPAFKKERPSGTNGSRRARKPRKRAPFQRVCFSCQRTGLPACAGRQWRRTLQKVHALGNRGVILPKKGSNSPLLDATPETRYIFLPQPCSSPRELFDKRWTGPGEWRPCGPALHHAI